MFDKCIETIYNNLIIYRIGIYSTNAQFTIYEGFYGGSSITIYGSGRF